MTVISFDHISLAFGADTVLDSVSFSLNEGDRLGIVGVNGAGKSSLMRIVTGVYEPTSGAVYIARDRSVGMLAQDAAPDADATLLEEALHAFPELLAEEKRLEELRLRAASDPSEGAHLAETIDRFTRAGGYEFRGRCEGVLRNLGFRDGDLSATVSSLSGGQKTRLALAGLLLRDPDILILDEPTNHLDTEALFWLENRLRLSRKTLIIVSHDRYFLDQVTNKTLELENGHGKLYDGNYSEFVRKKAEDREIQERHYQNQQREIARIEAYIEQQRRWNRERNIIAAESREKQLAKMTRVERPDRLPGQIHLSFSSSGESGEDVMTLRHLSGGYGDNILFRDVDLVVKKRDRLFLLGPNGCGKSTLVKCLMGRISPLKGEVEYGSEVQVGYYDQENQQLNPNDTVLDSVWNEFADRPLTEVRGVLAQFLFRGDDVQKLVKELSGGEKARLTLAKLILDQMNLLILDEPTNHLDIGSREALESALSSFDGTLVIVSHDRYFIKKLATRIVSFGKGSQKLSDFNGTYEDYLAKQDILHPENTESDDADKASDAKESYLARKQEQADQRKAEKRRKTVEAKIASIEKRIGEIDEEMNTSAATDASRLMELGSEKDQLEETLLSLYEETMG